MNAETFFNPQGRLNRSQFQAAFLVLTVLGAINACSAFVPVGMASMAVGSLSILFSVVLAYMWIAIWVKRLHDAGTSGWMTILIVLAWFVGFIIMSGTVTVMMMPVIMSGDFEAIIAAAEQVNTNLVLVSIIADTVLTLVIAFALNAMLNSDPGENDYGPSPDGKITEVFE